MITPILFLLLATSPPQDDAKPEIKTFQIPYRLTNTNHLLVRVKLNGKGPFHFILDTGAPALFIGSKAAKQAELAAGADGWATIKQFQLEGGIHLEKVKARVEDLFQLEGMNGMGMAGVELHGIIGYTILARYRLEFDFTRNKMGWTPLAFKPDQPFGLGGGQNAGGMEAMGSIMKTLGSLLGKKPQQEVGYRGFLGILLEEKDGAVVVQSVLSDSPADQAGIKAGDLIRKMQGKTVTKTTDLEKVAGKLASNEKAVLSIERAGSTSDYQIQPGKGF